MAREWSYAVDVRNWSRATSIPPHPPVDLQLSQQQQQQQQEQQQQQQAPGKFTTLTQRFSVFPLYAIQPVEQYLTHVESYSVLGYGTLWMRL
jgi:hypothetical protein